MSDVELRIDRIGITLHGVSAQTAQEALAGLEGELARRLAARGQAAAAFARSDLAEVALGPFTLAAAIDAAGLRALVADALAAQLLVDDRSSAGQTAEGLAAEEPL